MKNKKHLLYSIALCLSLGLAPFSPEPHIWHKIIWISEGANGMQLIDYFDLFIHGAPWLLFIYLLVKTLVKLKTSKTL